MQKKKKEDKKQINVHIMHSMKGGCGKSTCTLFKTLQLAHKADFSDRRAHVLFLDADLKGSAMMKVLLRVEDSSKMEVIAEKEKADYLEISGLNDKQITGVGFEHTIAIPTNFDANKTLSNYLRDNSQLSLGDITYHSYSYQKGIKSNKANGETDTPDMSQSILINGFVDFIFSSASAESKDWFRHKQGMITAGIYKYRMETLLRSILNSGVVNNEQRGVYSDIVIDMPPGYDEYSDILLDILRSLAVNDKNIKLHYYAITTEDMGHRELTRDNIMKILHDSTEYKAMATVNLVLSSPSEGDFKRMSIVAEDYYKWLEIRGRRAGKLYRNEYQDSYHKFCRMAGNGQIMVDIENDLSEIV